MTDPKMKIQGSPWESEAEAVEVPVPTRRRPLLITTPAPRTSLSRDAHTAHVAKRIAEKILRESRLDQRRKWTRRSAPLKHPEKTEG